MKRHIFFHTAYRIHTSLVRDDTYAFIVQTGLISNGLTPICSKRREIFLGHPKDNRMECNGVIKIPSQYSE